MSSLIPIFISLALSVVVAVVPVKLVAKALQVENNGWLICVIAVVFATIIGIAANYILVHALYAIPVAIGVVGFVYESIFETQLKKALVIAGVCVLIEWLAFALFYGAGGF